MKPNSFGATPLKLIMQAPYPRRIYRGSWVDGVRLGFWGALARISHTILGWRLIQAVDFRGL